MNLLELRFLPIEKNQYCFKVSVEGSSGEAHDETTLPFLDDEISGNPKDRRFTVVKIIESIKFEPENFPEEEQAWMVREQLLLSEQNSFHPQWLVKIGRKLYQVLGQKIQQVIETEVANAKRDRTWLHIRLSFPADDPKYIRLSDYPWELLRNDYGFLAHQGVTFSRYIAYGSPRPNLSSLNLLNVLLISSGASDEGMGLKSLPSEERDAIAQGLQHAQEQKLIRLEILNPPTLNQLRKRLIEHQTVGVPHVLHFDGHGFFGKRCNQAQCKKAHKQSATQCTQCGVPLGEPQGYLVFEQIDGTADYVSAQELGELLGNLQRREQPNSEQGIALVVLSSCRSGMSRLSDSVFNGVAQNLIGRGIPAVVAMGYTVSVRAARDFTETFYRSLGQKNSLAIAVSSGKSAIGVEGNEWYRPVLYLRWADNDGGQLFKDSAVQSNQPIQTSPAFPVQHTKNQELYQVMTLSKEQKKKLQDALISAFPNKADLERLLEYELDIKLNIIAGGENYTDIVFNLLKWFESQGRTQDIIQAAYKVNSGNPQLKEFIREIDIETRNNSIPTNNSSKKRMSRAKQLQNDHLNEEIAKLDKDYKAVAEKKRRESNPQEQHNLQLQLDHIFKQIQESELQLERLEYGDE